MRYLALPVLILSALVVRPEAAFAQGAHKIKIEKVQVGFPHTAETTWYKAGAWTPVYVYLTNEGSDAVNTGEYALVVETADSEDVQNHYTERRLLPLLNPGESTNAPLLAYVRPGGDTSEITVQVQSNDGRTLDSKKPDTYASEALPVNAQVVLQAGSKLPGMKRALIRSAENKPGEGVEDDESLDSRGPLRFVYAEKVEQLPARWFGYQGIDLLMLTTSRKEFISDLLTDATGRKEALVEWVRRGGQLVISAERNKDFVDKFLDNTKLLNCRLVGTVRRKQLDSLPKWAATEPLKGTPIKGKPEETLDVEFSELVPGRGVDVLAKELGPNNDKMERPTIVQGGCGLGRVLLTAFDLDAAPFTSWKGPNKDEAFWRKLAEEMDIHPVTQQQAAGNPVGPKGKGQQGPQFPGATREPVELAGQLQDSLEGFDDVPVISFGWVALFIFFYILIVGPIDYFVLKKLVKRLELTWVTFPAVVLTISGIAYFTAYWLKGNDLKVNKIDVVDIDLNSSRAYGSTWFTIYSPRIQNYTVGVEPAPAGWNWTSPKIEATGDHAVLVDWMGRPEADWERRSQQGILNWNRPTFRYAPDGAGLEGVPIRVWATKSFTASWKMTLTEGKPLFEAGLHRVGGAQPDLLEGTITSHLPVDLKDVTLLYKDKAYEVPGGLTQGLPRSINDLKIGAMAGGGENLNLWLAKIFDERTSKAAKAVKIHQGQSTTVLPARAHMKSLLFHAARTDANADHNSQLRSLDESWRLKESHREEVILIGRTAYVEGKAEDVSKNDVSASRLWLGGLPDSGKPRKDLEGTLSQETFVRVYIPVTPRN
jgi:hypothetical protein